MPRVTRRSLLAASGGLGLALTVGPTLARAAAGQGAAIRLSLNESAYGPSPRVAEAIAASIKDVSRYPDDADTEALIGQIAALEKVPAAQVVLGEVLEPLGL